MKRLNHLNGQPVAVKEAMDWSENSVRSALREHISDMFSPGFVPGTGSLGGRPCEITAMGSNWTVKIGQGVAIAPLSSTWPSSGIDQSVEGETGGERIVVSSSDASVAYVDSNPDNKVNDGTGTMVKVPASTGTVGVPVNHSSSADSYTYIWISYLDTTSTSASDVFKSKTVSGKNIYPVIKPGYAIATTSTSVAPDNSPKWLLIGSVYLAKDNASDSTLQSAIIDQSYQVFSDLRSNSNLDKMVEYQNESHYGGIIGSGTSLALDCDDSPEIGGYASVARCIQISGSDAVYVDGNRGTKISNTYTKNNVEYAYVGFSSSADTDVNKYYYIYVDYIADTGKFVLAKSTSSVPSGKALLGSVYWDGQNLSSKASVDLRSFGLTGTGNLKDACVTNAKLAADISPAKIVLPAGQLIVGGSEGFGQAVSASGDISVDSSGKLTISDGAVTSRMLSDASVLPAAIDSTKSYTVASLQANTSLLLPNGATSNSYLTCNNASTGEVVWSPIQENPGQIPAPIRWMLEGEPNNKARAAATIMDRGANVTSITGYLYTAPGLGNSVSITVYRNSSNIVGTINWNAGENLVKHATSLSNTAWSVDDVISLSVSVSGSDTYTFGEGILVTIGFANEPA